MATDEMLCAQLMKAAKTGNVKEVKKLLHKGALFTKDEVNKSNSIIIVVLYVELATVVVVSHLVNVFVKLDLKL